MRDFTGEKFGRLLAFDYIGNYMWRCLCDCGNFVSVRTANLKSGNTKSCGCLRRDVAKKMTYKHGESKKNVRLYVIWCAMKARCFGKNNDFYKYYGGRGIKVCSSWCNYIPFRNWALANGYEDNLTIDRINNDGNYEPNNCQWITKSKNLKKRHLERRQKNENRIIMD